MTGGMWFLNEDGTDCDELNWLPPVGLDHTEEELDQLMDEALKTDPALLVEPQYPQGWSEDDGII
jgi:hypothetical protein